MKRNISLAQTLEKAKKVSRHHVIRSSDLTRTEKTFLLKKGFLKEAIKGWYILLNSNDLEGESTFWYVGFWNFLEVYLNTQLGENYCLSAECSLDLWAESSSIPKQVIVMTNKSSSYIVHLPFNTGLLIYKESKKFPENIKNLKGLQVMPLELALVRASPIYFRESSLNLEILLRMVYVGDIIRELLKSESSSSALRIVEAYKQFGFEKESKQVIEAMDMAGFSLKPIQNLKEKTIFLAKGTKVVSPYTARIKALWSDFRPHVIENFTVKKFEPFSKKEYFDNLEDIYVNDAYNSLSIEGYSVSPELIEKVRNGEWPPYDPKDAVHMNALAAKGYREAYKAVKKSLEGLFKNKKAGTLIEKDLQKWYQKLFDPLVKAGILPIERLAGYRNHPVFIRNSRHVPPRTELLPELMDTFFELLKKEKEASVRAVLGHFFFVYIHPYMDGNGRLGRFIMNFMLASGHYPWTIVSVTERKAYLSSLEKASVDHNIVPLTKFLTSAVNESIHLLKK